MRNRVVGVVICFIVSTSLLAQATTASLTGRASSNGVPVPDVTVTVSSPALIGARSTTTSADGYYVLPALAPGEYVVRFEGEGLEPVAQRATLRLAETSRVDAELTLQPLRGEIVVRPATPALFETPQASTNISGETLELLPAGRGILDALRLAPGTTVDGSDLISINGAEVYDSLFMVNGVTVGSRTRNQPLNLFIEDAIQEATILTSGISADYGRFTGGVVNVLTKSGGNELSGSVRDTLSSDSWRARTPYPAEPEHLSGIDHELQGTLGGRIVRDRLWFFASGRLFERDQRRTAGLTLEPYTFTDHEDRAEVKLTAAVARNQTFVGSYLTVNSRKDNSNPQAGDVRVLGTNLVPLSLTALHYTAIPAASLVVEAQYSYKVEAFDYTGGDPDPVRGMPVFDFDTGLELWAPTFCGVCGDAYGNARDYLVKGSWFRPTARLGTHELVFGGDEYHDLSRTTLTRGPTGLSAFTPASASNGALVLQLVPELTTLEYTQPQVTPESDFRSRAFFLNDRVTLGRYFTATAGLRHDHNYAVNADGVVVVDDARLSPRAGLVYDVGGDGRNRVNTSFGRYTAKAQEMAARSAEQATFPLTWDWIYDGPEVNTGAGDLVPNEEVIRQLLAWFEGRGGKENLSGALLGFSPPDSIEDTLDSPYADEVTVGFAHRFGDRGVVQLNLVRREWASFYALHVSREVGTVDLPDGQTIDRVLLDTDDEGLEREYRGAQLQADFALGGLTLAGNYTYSTLRGNVEGSAAGGTPTARPSLVDYYPELTGYAQFAPVGYLLSDIRHVANAWAIYRFPGQRHRFTVSLLQRYHSGRPYNLQGNIDPRLIQPNPGYALSPSLPYYFAPRGSLRRADVTSTGIGLHYSLNVGALELLAHGNVTNIFNEQALENAAGTTTFVNTSRTDRNLAPFNPLTQTPIECPRGVRSSSAQCKGIANYQLPASFGVPRSTIAYQQPRAYSLSLAVRF
jgi:hypothetical protein